VRGAHALRLDNSKTLDAIQKLPHESTRSGPRAAKQYLDYADVVRGRRRQATARLRDPQRDRSGQIPGPRHLAASQEITVTGSLGDDMLPHLPFPEMSFGTVVDGPEDMRKAVRMFLKYGVDTIKLNLSGDNLVPGADATTNWMSDEEVAIAQGAKVRGKRVSCHARSPSPSSRRCATASTSSTTRASPTKRRSTCWKRRRTRSSSRRASR
jgi:imidazolonepropionase-like amidohydrolase